MPRLDWIGKDKVVNHHLEVPYRVLDRVYSFDESARNVRDALHRADELMYEDKRAYYREHPERRRSTSKDSFHLELEEEAQGA